MVSRLAELEARLDRCSDPREREQIEVMIAELAEDLDDPEPSAVQLDEWALLGEDRMFGGGDR